MAAPVEITPGVLSPAQAAALSAAMGVADRVDRALAADRVPWRDEFPARLTAWDESTQRASWTEETWDEAGQRRERTAAEGGRTGTATWNPAVPVGNGLMPPDAFPVQVWLRRRGTTDSAGTNVGVVYEFDWVCACAGAGSGSGPGGTDTGVLTPCCPGAIPAALTATLAQSGGVACAAFPVTIPLAYAGGTWSGSATTGSGLSAVTWGLTLACTGGAFAGELTITQGAASCVGSLLLTLDSCTPLQITSGGTIAAGCPCDGAGFTLTITE